MHWLSKTKANIYCGQGVATLISENGDRIQVQGTVRKNSDQSSQAQLSSQRTKEGIVSLRS